MKTDIESLFLEHFEFVKNTFPKGNYKSSLKGLKREIKEVEWEMMYCHIIGGNKNRKKIGLEYIDCFMYLLDSFRRAGFEIEDLKDLFKEKLQINKNRNWKINKDKTYSHI